MGLLFEMQMRPLDTRRQMPKRRRRLPRRISTFTPENIRLIQEQLLIGVPLRDIATDLDTTVNSIRATFSKLRIELPSPEDRLFRWVIRLSPSASHVLKVEARYRDMKPVQLVERLLDAIAADKLFDAILDK